jgi:parallel beta-helix repeat protein
MQSSKEIVGYQTDGINVHYAGTNIRIENNSISYVAEGIDLFGSSMVVTGNTIKNIVDFGIKLVHGASFNWIENNLIEGVGRAALLVAGSPCPGGCGSITHSRANVFQNNRIGRIGDLSRYCAPYLPSNEVVSQVCGRPYSAFGASLELNGGMRVPKGNIFNKNQFELRGSPLPSAIFRVETGATSTFLLGNQVLRNPDQNIEIVRGVALWEPQTVYSSVRANVDGVGTWEMFLSRSDDGRNWLLKESGADVSIAKDLIDPRAINGGVSFVAVGDFNADGRQEPLFFWSSGNLTRWPSSLGSSFAPVTSQTLALPTGVIGLQTLDLNGDGRSDLRFSFATSTKVFLSTSTGFKPL